jgi:hypothetical protein
MNHSTHMQLRTVHILLVLFHLSKLYIRRTKAKGLCFVQLQLQGKEKAIALLIRHVLSLPPASIISPHLTIPEGRPVNAGHACLS